jgi:energy-coupling factor transporter ATP-binding protein EcfA2
MFGRRSQEPSAPNRVLPAQESAPMAVVKNTDARPVPIEARVPAKPEPVAAERRHSEEYYDVKTTVFNALIDTIDLTQLAKLEAAAAREEIRDIVSEIIQIKNVVMSIAEQEELLEDICNDVLGYGPLEPLLARDDIADIMVNGATTTYIEVAGKVQKTQMRFADNAQLMNICQRIVSQVGRRVDESSPICDARLPDGSRVNVIAPPLAIDGPALTIRKFKKDRLKLAQLLKYKSISLETKTLLEIIGRVRCNVLISGGTGSGKTTLLNCLTGSIDNDERIITCEDSAELQLQQPHVVRLETRPPNLEGEGEINHARSRQKLPAHAARAHHRRRGARTGGVRPSAGHEYRPRRLDGHTPRQQSARGPEPPGIDDHDGRIPAAAQDHPRDDHRLHRRHHPGLPPARRLAQDHARHRGGGHGRRCGDAAEPHRLRDHGRGRAGQDRRSPPLHRHCAPALLGPRGVLRRDGRTCAQALASAEVRDRTGNPLGDARG